MKKVAFIFLLSIASLTLSSFGVVDNPKAAMTQSGGISNIKIDSKSTQASLNSKPNTKAEAQIDLEENKEGWLKRFFKITFAFLTKLVWSLMTK